MSAPRTLPNGACSRPLQVHTVSSIVATVHEQQQLSCSSLSAPPHQSQKSCTYTLTTTDNHSSPPSSIIKIPLTHPTSLPPLSRTHRFESSYDHADTQLTAQSQYASLEDDRPYKALVDRRRCAVLFSEVVNVICHQRCVSVFALGG
ncbi:hypothetical protein BASA60_000672 [Batrachochytrium salamandrivorans]|nr:hypothetical protein BASA60_000672 [Batrachochytrium salamandrivorans]